MKLSLKEKVALRLINMLKWGISKGGYYKCRWNDMIAHIGAKIMPMGDLVVLLKKVGTTVQ